MIGNSYLERAEAAQLDQSRAIISLGEFGYELNPGLDHLATLEIRHRFDSDMLTLSLGALPSWISDSAFDLELREASTARVAELELVGRREGMVAFVATLDRDSGLRITRLRAYDSQFRLCREFILRDYRVVGDTRLPFFSLRRDINPETGEELMLEIRHALNVELDSSLIPDPALFTVPKGYRIQDLR